jgi:hypothetical protein
MGMVSKTSIRRKAIKYKKETIEGEEKKKDEKYVKKEEM